MLTVIILILLGFILLLKGADFLIDGSSTLAAKMSISEIVIGLTIVSIGTFLPELSTSTVAAYKKKSDIAIGNIVGSNIFNIFFILGISAVVRPLPFQ